MRRRVTHQFARKIIEELTERDKEIILTLYEQRYLKLDQLQRLFFSSRDGAQKRLRILYRKGFVDRLRPRARKGSAQYVYFLSELGVYFVALHKGMRRNSLKWKRKQLKDQVMFLEHTLAINDVYVALKELEKGDSKYKFIEWVSEREFRSRFWDLKGILPDAFFKLGVYERAIEDFLYYDFFLEMDMGTMRLKRIRDKVKDYLNLYLSGSYKSFFHFYPTVLVVAPSELRLKTLKDTTEKVLKGCSDVNFLFTTRDKLNLISNAIWKKAFTEDKFDLFLNSSSPSVSTSVS